MVVEGYVNCAVVWADAEGDYVVCVVAFEVVVLESYLRDI